MRFDGLKQIGESIIHQTTYATWYRQDEIEVMRWANGKFMERVTLTAKEYKNYREWFTPYHSHIRYVKGSANIPLTCRGMLA